MISAGDHLALLLREEGLYFEQEYRFAPPRRWRADFHLPPSLLVEIEGVKPGPGGRHQRIAGFLKDLEKYAEATALGFVVLRVSTKMVSTGAAIDLINRTLKSHNIWM